MSLERQLERRRHKEIRRMLASGPATTTQVAERLGISVASAERALVHVAHRHVPRAWWEKPTPEPVADAYKRGECSGSPAVTAAWREVESTDALPHSEA